MACIVKNKEFRAICDQLDIHEDALEQIIKEWQGDIPAREGVIPSVAYIREQISGKDNFVDANYLDKATKIWEQKFSEPKIFDSLAEANAYKDEANKFFVEEATYIKKTKDGRWSVTTRRPEQSIKFSIEEMRNLESSGLYNLLDFMSRQKEYGDARRGELLSKLHDRYYLPKTTSQDALERFRVMYLLPEGIFNLTKVGDAIEVTINEDVLKDAIERNNRNIGFDNLFDSAEEAEETKRVLDFLSSKTGLKYETISEEKAKELLGKDEITNVNAFVKGDTAYFIEGRRLNTDIAAEEMLHPFVASIKAMNVEAFNSLVLDARKAFPKLRLEINKSYTKDSVSEELVTQALSRAFREDIKENPHGNNVKTLLKNFLNYVVSIFKSTFGDNNIITRTVTRIDEILEKKSFNASDLVQNIKIADLAKLINSELNISGADFIKSERLNEEEKTEEGKQPQRIRKSNEGYVKQSTKFIKEIDSLLGDSNVSSTDVRQTAIEVAYFLHDTISDLIENPKKIFENQEFGKQDTKNIDKEVEKISNMSRSEVVQYLGVRNLLNYAKAQLFDNIADSLTMEMLDEAELYKNNFDALVKIGMTTFCQIENFGLASNMATQESMEKSGVEDFNVVDNMGIDADDFSTMQSYEQLVDEIGNLQEHWQVESRTLDVLQNATALVKDALGRCFITRKVETANPDGSKSYSYERVKTKWGTDSRVDAKDATSSILRWTRGSLNLSDMINNLKKHQEDNPWVNQIIERLEDTSGKESSFQSQFYKVFEKHFQTYSVVRWDAKNNKYVSSVVNSNPARKEAMTTIKNAYKSGTSPIFADGKINSSILKQISDAWIELNKMRSGAFQDVDLQKAARMISFVINNFGLNVSDEMVLAVLSESNFKHMVDAIGYAQASLKLEINNEAYNPFDYDSPHSINGNITQLISPITDTLEDTAITSFNDSGKMFQSYVTPSYLSKMFIKFQADDKSFNDFIQGEYGSEEFFRHQDEDITKATSWRNMWLQELAKMSPEMRQKIFAHKVQLNFNKRNYMRGMNGNEYIMSILAEYFSEDTIGGVPVAWYRVPMMSNKPSSEFVRFKRYNGQFYKDAILKGFQMIFEQEISRIQTVNMMEEQGSNVKIKNFRKRGKEFLFLDFLNKEVKNGTELGRLIQNKIDGKSVNEARLKSLLTDGYTDESGVFVPGAIQTAIDAKADAIIESWRKRGVLEHLNEIKGINKDFADNNETIRNFVWNDTLAAMNFLELTITDLALYKDAEDVQKRLAQLHSPGLRGNAQATDFEGNSVVGDGTIKSVVLKDFDKVKTNIQDNLKVVFNRKVDAARERGDEQEARGWEVTRDSIIEQFDDINVADGQAFKSPTAARKIGFIFGTWTEENERLYNLLQSGKYTYQDVKNAFTEPRKPFVYSTVSKNLGVTGAPLSTIRKGVQYKNSEYLIILADAIMRSEPAGQPNLLKAIFDFMEDSFRKNPDNGIDTVMFDSCVKTGLGNTIDINQFLSMSPEDGEKAAYDHLMQSVILPGGVYNELYVDRLKIEDYSEQQEIPEHFKAHEQQMGSQVRYIIPSDLEFSDEFGNPVTYDFVDNGEAKKFNATEFKKEYEETVAENIREDINVLEEEFGIGNKFISNADKNVAISKILQREILTNPRYGIDLLQACSVDENGNFRIPLNDPIQSKRIEQLLNSVIKNRVNKQLISGGPVVQVSNFGTSHRLSIVFQDKNGNILIKKSDYKPEEHNGQSYDDYLKENQEGIAYFEAYAPIYDDRLLRFANNDGFIDIDAINKVNPDLLKMIGYRIPSEDKYSVFPVKIVGFLPREAGDALMLPYEITKTTGSDFDIDKIYLMKKDINITKGIAEAIADEIGESLKTKESRNKVNKEVKSRLNTKLLSIVPDDILTDEEKSEVMRKVNEDDIQYTDKDGNKKVIPSIETLKASIDKFHQDKLDRIDATYERKSDKNENADISDEEYNKRQDEIDANRDLAIANENTKYEKKLQDLEKTRLKRYARELSIENKKQAQILVDSFLIDPLADTQDAVRGSMKQAYIEMMYGTTQKSEGRTYRNNKIFDMSWATLTNPTTADKMLNPGGFEPQKKMGYAVEAYRNQATKENGQKYTLRELLNLDVDTLKDLCLRDKNISNLDTHIQFYEQNSAAGEILGIFAVAKVAHTALEGYDYAINIDDALSLEGNTVNIMGHDFSGTMNIDFKYNSAGNLISKTLGSLVASAADAVKDPVLNLMNINADTVNVLNIAIRMGVPFEDIAMLLSSDAITNALAYYNSQKLNGDITFDDIVKLYTSKYERNNKIDKNSPLFYEDLTEEEVEKSIAGLSNEDKEEREKITYKILKAYQRLSTLANQVSGLDYCTRFNSIANAVGPLISDNIRMEYKLNKFGNNIYKYEVGYMHNGNIYKYGDSINIDGANVILDNNVISRLVERDIIQPVMEKKKQINQDVVFSEHPILNEFSRTLYIAREIMGDSPIYASSFSAALNALGNRTVTKLMSKKNRSILADFVDFYQSYLLVASGAIKQDRLRYLIDEFPAEFFKDAKVKYADNALIQAIRQGVVETTDNKVRQTLEVNTTGMDTRDKERLQSGWVELQKVDPTLSRNLFEYAFFKGGIGFNPKTFMHLVPTQVKLAFNDYIDTFKNIPDVNVENIAKVYIQNNANNTTLVPIETNPKLSAIQGIKDRFVSGNYRLSNADYFKASDSPTAKIYVNTGMKTEKGFPIFTTMDAIGNNGEYLEFDDVPIHEDAVKKSPDAIENGIMNMPDETPATDGQINPDFSASDALRMIFDEDIISEHKYLPAEVKNSPAHIDALKNHIKESLKKHGIDANEKQIEEVYDKFC